MNTQPQITPKPAIGPDSPRWSETLRDHSNILIRPIAKTDHEAEREFIQGLSLDARRFRFLGQIAAPSEQLLDRFTDIDYVHDVAFVAVVRDDGRERIVGVSRYSTDDEGLRCECAVTVSDDWRNKGLATALMRHLIDIARSRGIRSMYSIDSAENTHMTDLARFLGFRSRMDPENASLVIHELEL